MGYKGGGESKLEIKSNEVIARRLASQTWGTVQQQQKIAEGFWSFSTAGHGGYVADTNVYPLLKPYQQTVLTHIKSGKYYPHEQHFAPFEEDCDWAIPLYLYPQLAEAEYKKGTWTKEFYTKYTTLVDYINNSVIPTIQRYHPEIYKK